MAIRANCTFKFAIVGDGRNETLVRQPLASNADFTVMTGGAVSLNSPAMFTKVVLQPGWNQLIDPAAYITTPMARNYFALIPPTGSTFAKVLAGATTDVGVSMATNVPLVLGLPAGAVNLYVYNAGATAETCGSWNW